MASQRWSAVPPKQDTGEETELAELHYDGDSNVYACGEDKDIFSEPGDVLSRGTDATYVSDDCMLCLLRASLFSVLADLSRSSCWDSEGAPWGEFGTYVAAPSHSGIHSRFGLHAWCCVRSLTAALVSDLHPC